MLHSITNTVKVTLYFDRSDEFFPDILALLDEYHAVNTKITIRTVDFVADAGEAEKVKAQYKLDQFRRQGSDHLRLRRAGEDGSR